jgi:hypothetical protein
VIGHAISVGMEDFVGNGTLGGRARVWYYNGTDGVMFVVYRQGDGPGLHPRPWPCFPRYLVVGDDELLCWDGGRVGTR